MFKKKSRANIFSIMDLHLHLVKSVKVVRYHTNIDIQSSLAEL